MLVDVPPLEHHDDELHRVFVQAVEEPDVEDGGEVISSSAQVVKAALKLPFPTRRKGHVLDELLRVLLSHRVEGRHQVAHATV